MVNGIDQPNALEPYIYKPERSPRTKNPKAVFIKYRALVNI
jgi:hypothetical protein